MQQHQVLQSWMRNLYPQVAIQERLHSLERLTWRCPESRMLWDDPRRRQNCKHEWQEQAGGPIRQVRGRSGAQVTKPLRIQVIGKQEYVGRRDGPYELLVEAEFVTQFFGRSSWCGDVF